MLAAAFAFLSEMLPPLEQSQQSKAMAAALKKRLAECLETDDAGRVKLTVTLPDTSALDGLAQSLAGLMGLRGQPGRA